MKLAILCFLLGPLAFSAGHRVVQITPLPGQGGADALLVDNAARRLYVARSNRLLIFDIDSGRQLSDIADLPGIAGIAVAPGIDRGYVTIGVDNRVAIFALSNSGHLGQIPLGNNPGAIVYDTSAHRFYAMNRGSKNASAIDADDGEVEETIDLGGRPGGAVSNDHGRVYVVLEDRGQIVEIDAKKMAFSQRWPIAGCESPHGIALDEAKGHLFVGCARQRLAIVNASDGSLIAMAATGKGGGDVVTDPSSGFVYVANTDGSISVVSETAPGKYETIETVPTADGTSVLAFDPGTHQVFALAPVRAEAGTGTRKPGEEKAAGESQLLVIGK